MVNIKELHLGCIGPVFLLEFLNFTINIVMHSSIELFPGGLK